MVARTLAHAYLAKHGDKGAEYIAEAEHGDGVGYWEQFNSLADVYADFLLYAYDLHTCPPEPLGCREHRAWFDPEGPCGMGATPGAALQQLLELSCEREPGL